MATQEWDNRRDYILTHAVEAWYVDGATFQTAETAETLPRGTRFLVETAPPHDPQGVLIMAPIGPGETSLYYRVPYAALASATGTLRA